MTNNTPPDPAVLRELIERVEAASADDQYDILVAAFEAIKGHIRDDSRKGFTRWHPDWSVFERKLKAFAFIDAAMTLVPDGCGWFIGWGQTRPDEPMGGARITRNARFIGHNANYDTIAEAEAATPALALCAASLRARLSS